VTRAVSGLRLAFGWLTVLPVRAPPVDRAAAIAAIRWAPLVGLLLGVLAAAALGGAVALGLPVLVAGVVTVAVLALATRGMHLDGLADTADALGSYGPPERALAVLRDPAVGAFGVAALVVVLAGQAAGLAALADAAAVAGQATRQPWTEPYPLLAVVVAVTTGRVAFAWCCRRGVRAARPDGLGALVAGSQPWWVAPVGWLVLAALAALATPARRWQGPLAVALAAGVVMLVCAHTARRFGGTVGDVHGAACELSVTTALVVLSAA
jgi:adenosylcobinamide-GDP ribazoletransferase